LNVFFFRHRRAIRSSKPKTTRQLLGFAIYGNSVNVASVVVYPGKSSPSEIREQFINLRDTGIVPKIGGKGRSFAFVFSCPPAAFSEHDGQLNHPTREFRRVFSGLPLLGFYGYGYGQVGHQHLLLPTHSNDVGSGTSGEPGAKRTRLEPVQGNLRAIHDRYSCVYVIVSVADAK